MRDAIKAEKFRKCIGKPVFFKQTEFQENRVYGLA